jgi:hypothetical protein
MDADRRARRQIQGHLSRQGEEEEEFDRRFWSGLAPEARLEALWDMVLEARVWKGESGDQPRLQRSVQHLRRA